MGVFNLGGVVGAFAKPKLKRIYLSDKLQGQIDTSTGRMDGYRGAMDKSLTNYESGMAENIAEQRRLNKMSEGELNADMALEGASDFMGDRERIRSGDLAALGSFMGTMGGTMNKADKLAAARLGYAGRPSSTYLDTARADRVGAYSAPIAQSIFAGLTSGATAADRARGNRLSRRSGLRAERGALPDRITDRMLQPAQARSWAMNDEIGMLGGLSEVNKSNFGGFKEEQNQWAQAIGAVDESLNSALDTAMSLYSGGMMGGGGGGGMLGGLMGGGGGGGGGGAPKSGVPPDQFYQYYNQPSAGMGGLTANQYRQAMNMRTQADPSWNPNLYE